MTIEAPAKMTALDHGIEHGIQWVTCQAPIYGAVNGYVKIPVGHHWHGLDYDAIDVEVHGGLTYSAGPWIGFDTLHSGDNWPDSPRYSSPTSWDRDWTPELVAEETKRLARNVAAADYMAANLSGAGIEYDDEDGA